MKAYALALQEMSFPESEMEGDLHRQKQQEGKIAELVIERLAEEDQAPLIRQWDPPAMKREE